MAKRRNTRNELPEQVAGNGLLHRRLFLQTGAAAAGAAAVLGAGAAQAAGVGEATGAPPWMLKPGGPFTAYGMPSKWRENIKRIVAMNAPPGREVTGSSRTPLE